MMAFLVGEEAAMLNFIGDAPFNTISLFIFYYALDYVLQSMGCTHGYAS
jgi:hypothetical protein